MTIKIKFDRQERPAGLTTLERVEVLTERAERAAASAAEDAVEGVSDVVRDEVEGLVAPSLALADDTTGIPLPRLDDTIDLSGEEDVREKLQAAINLAENKPILIPRNSKLLVRSTEPLRPNDSPMTSIIGAPGAVIEHYEESTEVLSRGWTSLFDLSDTQGKTFSLRDVTLQGQFFADRTQGSMRLLNGERLGRVELDGVTLRASRAALGVIKGSEFFRATRLTMEYSQRDGIMFIVPAGPVVIDDFDARWLRDDVFHVDFNDETENTSLTYPPGGQDISISRGRLLATLGILVSGGRRVTIRDIHARFVSNRLIRVGTIVSGTYAGVGTTSIMDVRIDGIIAEDMIFNPDRPGPPLRVIDISMPVAAAGNGDGIPTLPNEDGHIVRPEGLYTSTRQGTDPAVPVPPAAGITVDNVIVRRIAKQGPFTDAGLGPFVGQEGDIDDFVLDDENTRPDVFFLSGSGNVRIGPNIDATGINSLVRYDPRDVPDRTFSVNATGGKVTDMAGSMFYVQPNRGEPMNHRIRFSGIEVDGDPWCINGSRSAAGAWNNSQTPSLFRASEMQDVEAVGLRVRNVQRIAHPIGWEAGVRGRDNILHCDPEALGNTAGNAGIRVVPAPSFVWQHVIEGSNPEDQDDWAKIMNPCRLEAPTMPDSGKWVEGQTVWNVGPDLEVLFWRRLTTGDSHVLGTDWHEVKAGS